MESQLCLIKHRFSSFGPIQSPATFHMVSAFSRQSNCALQCNFNAKVPLNGYSNESRICSRHGTKASAFNGAKREEFCCRLEIGTRDLRVISCCWCLLGSRARLSNVLNNPAQDKWAPFQCYFRVQLQCSLAGELGHVHKCFCWRIRNVWRGRIYILSDDFFSRSRFDCKKNKNVLVFLSPPVAARSI